MPEDTAVLRDRVEKLETAQTRNCGRIHELEKDAEANAQIRTFFSMFAVLAVTSIIGAAVTLATTGNTADQNRETIQQIDGRQRAIQQDISQLSERGAAQSATLERIENMLERPPR